jgi:hypothetical protein
VLVVMRSGFMRVCMAVPMLVLVLMFVIRIRSMPMLAIMVGFKMHLEPRAGDAVALVRPGVQVVAADLESGERALDFGEWDAQIEQGAEKHVTADAAD